MPTLGYWNTRGLAQPIRLLLHHVGEEFDDVQYELGDGPEFSKKEWDDVKDTLGVAFPNLPYYIDGDVRISQSNAILRHIGKKHGLLGKTSQEETNVDVMMENAMDLRYELIRLAYSPDYTKLIAEFEPKFHSRMTGYNKWLSDKRWFAGDNLTVVDFHIYELLDELRMMIPGILTNYPKLLEFLDTFEALPGVKAYMASDKFIIHPVNNKIASFK